MSGAGTKTTAVGEKFADPVFAAIRHRRTHEKLTGFERIRVLDWESVKTRDSGIVCV
ncbi:hypothetical protein SAMN04488539_0633 [Corynebacterium timonense]|uniref:Uncharacterized protein n=1 Tax=Corynebacterium timonense TaxID=441500 RepID=A0A1H1MXJ3_9CORY|nr:hypothetical protein SAMN04488539_0633 [Corynebacterium timonense]